MTHIHASRHTVDTREWNSTTKEYETKRYDIELSIDIAKLARRLGIKAAQSKGGISRAYSGLIKAKYIRPKVR